ncbi:MAG: hypothetical protein WKF78_12675 [Candidatus Limnocylindrales bacterium]
MHIGDRPHEHRLAETGHALQQDVAVGKEAGQRLSNEVTLADDDPTDLALDDLGPFGEGLGSEANGRLSGDGSFHGGLRVGGSWPNGRTDQFEGSSELK